MNVFNEDGSWNQVCAAYCTRKGNGTYTPWVLHWIPGKKNENKRCEDLSEEKCLDKNGRDLGLLTGLRVRLVEI